MPCTLRSMTEDIFIRVVFLGSGSSGNATAITDGETTLLVDCGFSAREVSKRLESVGIAPASVTAVLLTHEHMDHVRGVSVFSRRHASDCAIYATRGTCEKAGLTGEAFDVTTVSAGETLRIGTLDVLPFCTSHDAQEPVGYRVERDGHAVGIATDTGMLTPEAAEALADVDILGIESNHDAMMLERGPYPSFLKRRIRSHAGHLSNEDAAAALERLASDRLRQVFGLHRSRTNNTAELARETLAMRVDRLGLNIPVVVARQDMTVDSSPPQGRLFERGSA